MKNELSENYKLGYKIGFHVALILIKKYRDDDELIEKLISYYNKQGLIEKIDIKELKELFS